MPIVSSLHVHLYMYPTHVGYLYKTLKKYVILSGYFYRYGIKICIVIVSVNNKVIYTRIFIVLIYPQPQRLPDVVTQTKRILWSKDNMVFKPQIGHRANEK